MNFTRYCTRTWLFLLKKNNFNTFFFCFRDSSEIVLNRNLLTLFLMNSTAPCCWHLLCDCCCLAFYSSIITNAGIRFFFFLSSSSFLFLSFFFSFFFFTSVLVMAIMIFDGTQPAQSRIRYGRSLTVRSVFIFFYFSPLNSSSG